LPCNLRLVRGKTAGSDRDAPFWTSEVSGACHGFSRSELRAQFVELVHGAIEGVVAQQQVMRRAARAPGTILGHEGVGVIDAVGAGVTTFKRGDRVLNSCISACGRCEYCRKGMYSHCTTGGWILGNRIDGTQAEYVRIPHADTSLYPIPEGADEEALVMLSDILPTGFECGVLNGKVEVGGSVAIVGSGPIGLAALLTAQFYSPSQIIMIDLDDNRLAVSRRFGATDTVNSAKTENGSAIEQVMKLTEAAVWTRPSGRWASRPPSSCARTSSPQAARSPTWACTASRSTCTWSGCGRTT
jgi:threonine dehydrogenase-like Zn-dependent dehydrogenase